MVRSRIKKYGELCKEVQFAKSNSKGNIVKLTLCVKRGVMESIRSNP